MEIPEYTIAGRSTATLLSITAFVLMILAMIVYVPAVATMSWGYMGVGDTGHSWHGLWLSCYSTASSSGCVSLVGNQGVSGLILTAQTFSIMGLAFAAIALSALGGYVYIRRFNKDTRIARFVTGICFGTAFMTMLTFVLFLEGFKEEVHRQAIDIPGEVSWAVGYSFAFCGIATGHCAIAGILMVVELFKVKRMIPA